MLLGGLHLKYRTNLILMALNKIIIFTLIIFLASGVSSNSIGEVHPEEPNITIRGKFESNSIKDFNQFVVYVENVNDNISSTNPSIIDQKNLTFIPSVLPLRIGGSVIFQNSDKESHIIHSQKAPHNFSIKLHPNQKSKPYVFTKEGEYALTCDFHPHMSAYILVLKSSYFSSVDHNGIFLIKDLPPGEYKITTWHPRYISKSIKISTHKVLGSYPVKFIY